MNRWLWIAYSLILGAWAALVAWVLLDPVLSAVGVNLTGNARAFADGAVVGMCVGAALGALEKYNSTRRAGATTLGCALGLGVGLVGGVAGLLLANTLYTNIQLPDPFQQVLLVIGWMIFGLAVGIAPGIAAWSFWKMMASSAGGCLGGILGGIVLLALGVLLQLPWISRAAGFVALALVVGALIALVQQATKRATLKITAQRLAPGVRPQEGRDYDIFERKVSVGSGRDHWVINNDPQIQPHHIEIRQEGGKFVLYSMLPNAPARVRNQPVHKHTLTDGDRFWIGGTEIAFKARKN